MKIFLLSLLFISPTAHAESFLGCWIGEAQVKAIKGGQPTETLKCMQYKLTISPHGEDFSVSDECAQSENPEHRLNQVFRGKVVTKFRGGELRYSYYNFDGETRYETRVFRDLQDSQIGIMKSVLDDDVDGHQMTASGLKPCSL